jgi:hypothetical protein
MLRGRRNTLRERKKVHLDRGIPPGDNPGAAALRFPKRRKERYALVSPLVPR